MRVGASISLPEKLINMQRKRGYTLVVIVCSSPLPLELFLSLIPPLSFSLPLLSAICLFPHAHFPWWMCSGAIIAVRGSVNDDGFYRGSFEGKTGLVPAGFVQEMEVEDSQQRKRLLNQTLSRPHLPSFLSQHHTPLSSSRPTSASLFSQLTPSPHSPHSPFLHTTGNSCNVYTRVLMSVCVSMAHKFDISHAQHRSKLRNG